MRKRKFDPNRIDISLPERISGQIIPDLLQAIEDGHGGFATQYLQQEILTKFLGPDTDSADVRRRRAIEKLLGVERLNERTNARLQYASIVDKDLGWISYGSLIRRIRSLVRRIIGPLVLEEVFSAFSHTNGASTRVRKSSVTAIRKLSGEAHISLSALPHWLSIICSSDYEHLNSGQTVTLRESSGLFTVPKKSDIDRVACKEPEINMLMQRACGNHIRRRLKQFGINLNDQTINQNKARDAYRDGLATIDLSSASDTISFLLVQQLLPVEWWSLLDDLRVKSTIIKGEPEPHQFELFSSMGNGFTFELESLIFYAITRVVSEYSGFDSSVISVYGDDIIAPNGIVPRLMRVLSLFGFIPNKKKTHSSGDFRESCGKHYKRGFDVTPFYIWRPIDTLPDLIRVLNRVMEWDARGWGFMTTPSLAAFHWKYSQHVPRVFWGGVDPEDCSSLVTGDRPRMRVVPRTRSRSFPQYEGMVHWIMSKENGQGSERYLSVDPNDDEFFERGVSENHLMVELDPSEIVGYKANQCSQGWHTAWTPWLIYQGAHKR